MKYQRAAIILATTAVLSICPLGSDALLDTTKHNGGVSKPSPMYGYCIGCVALLARTSDNTEPSAKTVPSSIEMAKTKTSSRHNGGLDHSTSATKLFLPSSTNTPPSGEHPTPPNATGHRLQSLVNLHHQLNHIMISRSMHNKQELFLQDLLLALSLFLVVVAIGFAWSNNNKDEEEHGDGCTSAERNKFDLISKRLLSDDFNGIGLTPTDDEEEDVQEQEVKKDVTQDASLLPPVVGSNTAEPQWTLRYRGEWEPLHPTNAEDDEQNVIEKEQVIILTKPIRNNAKVVKSILTGSASNNNSECSSALKVTKRVSFQEDVAQDEEEVTSVSSVTKKSRKGLWLKLSLAHLCEMKSRE
eukprot:scaffold912_cov121-Skeletonema_dohrnii-CCMP3373.AAC.19